MQADGGGRREQEKRVEELERELRERYPDRRQRALAKLAALGTRDAWELVLRGLADPAPQVADEARVRLAATDAPFVVDALVGESGLASEDEWVRVRGAETLARSVGAVDLAALARALDPRDVGPAKAIVSALERRARAAGLRDVPALAAELADHADRRLDPLLRCRVLSALALLAPDASLPLLEDAMGDELAVVRCAGLEGYADVVGFVSMERLRAMASDPAASVRALVVDLYERFASRRSMLDLADLLAREERPAIRARALAALQRLSGRPESLDPEAWRELVRSLPDYWRPPEGATAAPPSGTSTLAGLPIVSDRLAILVDFSGSLWRVHDDGRSRKKIVDHALRAGLEALPGTTRFNVIPYTATPHPWRDALVDATRANVSAANRDFEACREQGSGNFFDAAILALADPEVDTILVLTDGVPTGGKRYDLDLLFEALLEENRYRRVVFDSILVDAPAGARKRWLAFAERTGGRSIALKLE